MLCASKPASGAAVRPVCNLSGVSAQRSSKVGQHRFTIALSFQGKRRSHGNAVSRTLQPVVAVARSEPQTVARDGDVTRQRSEGLLAEGGDSLVDSSLTRQGGIALGLAALALLASAPEAQAAVAELGSKLTIPGVVGDSPLTEGLVSGFLLILFSEIGDKTFFIAMLLALQQSKTEVFTGTFGALAIMTVISVGLGQVLHQVDELLPPGVVNLPLDDIFAVVLLVIFGVQTLQAAGNADENAAEEKEEAEETVAGFGTGSSFGFVLSTFALVFAAEWGDKSFIATIALAAASSPVGVVGGAVAGHGVATAIAVTFGSVLSKYVSERTVQYVGGSLFLVFAAATLVDIFAETQG